MRHINHLIRGLAVILFLYANFEGLRFVFWLSNQSSDVTIFMGLVVLMILAVSDYLAYQTIRRELTKKGDKQ